MYKIEQDKDGLYLHRPRAIRTSFKVLWEHTVA